jgi:hypothetical protein
VVPTAFVDDGLGNSSHLVELDGGRGLVVDPVRHPGAYVAPGAARALRRATGIDVPVETTPA